jgi:hypothetical protein
MLRQGFEKTKYMFNITIIYFILFGFNVKEEMAPGVVPWP